MIKNLNLFRHNLPSLNASAVIYTARKLSGCELAWTLELEQMSKYNDEEVKTVSEKILSLSEAKDDINCQKDKEN